MNNKEYKAQIRFIPLNESKSFDVPFKPFNEETAQKIAKDGKKALLMMATKWSVDINENGEVISIKKLSK